MLHDDFPSRLDCAIMRHMNNIRRALRAERARSGITQDGLASAVGVSRSAIGRLERGDRFPTIVEALAIEALLGDEVRAEGWIEEARSTTPRGAGG